MCKKLSGLPLIVICGETGTGKSKLAIEVAEYFQGEVINADALQVYGGMDIATNKVTAEEMKRVPHHLLGCESVSRLDYTIHDFQKAALAKIEDLKKAQKIPVLVGGTNYYLESILWHKLVDVDVNSSEVEINRLNSMTNIELYDYLKSIDPQSAAVLHPNTRRKIIRAIEVFLSSSETQYSHLKAQESSRRFPLNETVFIWVHSEKESLFPRVEKRVDAMIADGLIKELEEMQQLYLKLPLPRTYTQGVFQAIGFKEFRNYLSCKDKNSENGQKMLIEGIERLKLANKQYVNSQKKWIKNRFLKDSGEHRNIPLFKVNSCDTSKWEKEVFLRSVNIIKEVTRCEEEKKYSDFVEQLSIKPEGLSHKETFTPCYNICETCDNQIFITVQSWDAHIKGKRHERRKRNERKRKLLLEKQSDIVC